jgi:hypothetical protein
VLVKGGPTRSKHWQAPPPAARAGLVAALRNYVATHPIDAMVESTRGTQAHWVAALTQSAFGAPTSVHGDASVWLKPASS